jgi:hypothetical protein
VGLGNAYKELGEFSIAIRKFHRAIAVGAARSQNQEDVAFAHRGIAECSVELGALPAWTA